MIDVNYTLSLVSCNTHLIELTIYLLYADVCALIEIATP